MSLLAGRNCITAHRRDTEENRPGQVGNHDRQRPAVIEQPVAAGPADGVAGDQAGDQEQQRAYNVRLPYVLVVVGHGCWGDGERQRVVLEALRLAFLRPGATVLLDEPERFLSARDVGPWIDVVLAAAQAPGGPQVVWASQHPEVARRLVVAGGGCGTVKSGIFEKMGCVGGEKW